MLAALGLEDVVVLNDFEAQALAVAALGDENREQIGGGAEPNAGPASCSGPAPASASPASSMRSTPGFRFPAKAAMSISARARERDFEIFPHLEPIEGRISAEQILCGRGLVNLYRAVCTADGMRADACRSGRGHRARRLPAATRPAVETRLAVRHLSRPRRRRPGAGLHGARRRLSRRRHLAEDPAGAEEAGVPRRPSRTRRRIRALMRDIPIFVVTHPLAALAGLAAYARTPARFGVATEGRRWRER